MSESKATPPFIRIAAFNPNRAGAFIVTQHFLNFLPLPHVQRSFRPTVIFISGVNVEALDLTVRFIDRSRTERRFAILSYWHRALSYTASTGVSG